MDIVRVRNNIAAAADSTALATIPDGRGSDE